MDKVSYAFVKEKDNLIFRSKVNSFNLDHVTDKDIASFYASFSEYSYFDTGLLPLDGTGLLGIRKAGNHTQVIYQYKPGMYYINWGASERDPDAKKYYLAQPYRIVIIDFLDNNLLGARTFYSVEPANHGGIQLYHVNLPNINCKGYRGNGVGWICLYHNEDWSALSFNDRLNRALERCSGVEVYNDANMSETDGPRFYAENEMPGYTSVPERWERKSESEGYEWTLDASEWLPILVKDKDNQEKHYQDGSPLTLVDAITGNYSAYYGDAFLPKPINAITRPDLSLEISQITNWFVKSYNSSLTTFSGIDPYSSSAAYKETISVTPVNPPSLFDEDEDNEDEESEDQDNDIFCPMSETWINSSDCGPHIELIVQENGSETNVCMNCVNNHGMDYVYVKNAMKFYDPSNKDLVYDTLLNEYYLISAIKNPWAVCANCESVHISVDKVKLIVNVWDKIGGIDLDDSEPNQVCENCYFKYTSDTSEASGLENKNYFDCCDQCSCFMPSQDSIFCVDTIIPGFQGVDSQKTCTTCSHIIYNAAEVTPSDDEEPF